MFDGGLSITTSSGIATLLYFTGVVSDGTKNNGGLFNSADGVVLLGALMLFPTGIVYYIGGAMLATALQHFLKIPNEEQIRTEGRTEGEERRTQKITVGLKALEEQGVELPPGVWEVVNPSNGNGASAGNGKAG